MSRWSKTLKTFLTAFVLFVLIWGPAQAQESKKSKPCFADLKSCPAVGCAKPGTPEALVNELKRSWPSAQVPVHLTLDDFESLQSQADGLFKQRSKLKKAQREALKKLQSSAGQVGEGSYVQVMGFMVGKVRPNTSGESVNCKLRGQENNDFHIPIARDPDDEEFDAIVTEMIPQKRPAGWTVTRLRAVTKRGLPVLVRGQLFYDNMHFVNKDPDQPKGGQPKRFSLWEVHPVSGFYACNRASKNCNPKELSHWEPLEKMKQ